MLRLLTACGTKRQFAVTQQFGRFRSEADIRTPIAHRRIGRSRTRAPHRPAERSHRGVEKSKRQGSANRKGPHAQILFSIGRDFGPAGSLGSGGPLLLHPLPRGIVGS